MYSIAVLASGDLGLESLTKVHGKYGVLFVMTDKGSAQIADYCVSNNIPFYHGNPKRQDAISFYSKFSADVIISVNYIFLIDTKLINSAKKLIFNLHGSLLPKYRGRTPHVWSIINGEKECGITAHIIDEGCDTGDILEQRIVPIQHDDTGAALLEKYKQLYFPMIEEVLTNLKNGNLKPISQNNGHATYFSKRTPEDSRVNWDWQKSRIYNWVRAQTNPYPGAFTFYDSKKVIIDRVRFSEHGFHDEMINGEIIGFEKTKPIVKVQNGAIVIDKIRNGNIQFKLNERFHD